MIVKVKGAGYYNGQYDHDDLDYQNLKTHPTYCIDASNHMNFSAKNTPKHPTNAPVHV